MTTSVGRDRVLVGDDATRELGRRLGRAYRGADVGALCLSGELGAGKTTLVKGLAAGLGVADERDVTSPTFLRLVRWEPESGDGVVLVHVDAYRMRGPADAYELGLDEDFASSACVVVEWPERIEAALPDDRLVIDLDHAGDDRRRARIVAHGPGAREWLDRTDLHGVGHEP